MGCLDRQAGSFPPNEIITAYVAAGDSDALGHPRYFLGYDWWAGEVAGGRCFKYTEFVPCTYSICLTYYLTETLPRRFC